MAPGSLDREAKAKSLEQKVFRDEGDQAEVVRDPCEGAEEDLHQYPTAAGEEPRPGQVRHETSAHSASLQLD